MKKERGFCFMDEKLKGFVLFCLERRGNQWPGLYDEMAIVAASGLYGGIGYEDLRRLGLSLSLRNIDKTRSIVKEVIAEAAVEAGFKKYVEVSSGKVCGR